MKFADPRWLWLLCLVPIFFLWGKFEFRKRSLILKQVVDPRLWTSVIPMLNMKAREGRHLFWLFGLVFLVLALARPQWGVNEDTIKVTGLDLVIALDVSNSMLVEDVVPSRLKKARHVIKTILAGMQGDRVGIVAFAASAYLATPLTTDLSYVEETIDILGPQSVVNQGTDIGIALETAINALERGAVDTPGGAESADFLSKSILLISDGEDLEERALEGVKKVKEAGAHLFVFGIGTENGGPIPMLDQEGSLRGYKRDGGQPVLSKFQSSALSQLAESADGKYWSITPDETEVQDFLATIGAVERTGISERKVVIPIERYQIPLALAVVFFLLELFVPMKKATAVVALMIFLISPKAEADSSLKTYFQNKTGVEKIESKEWSDARKALTDAQVEDPERAELMFNQGVVQTGEEDFEKSAESFEHAARLAEQQKDLDLSARAQYNRAIALEKGKKIDPALRAFRDAIESAKKAGNAEVESDARKKIEMLSAQKQQQQQKGGDKKEEEEKDEKDRKEKKKDGEDKDQEGKGNKDKDQEGSEGKDQEKEKKPQKFSKQDKGFESKKLSPGDARRIMNELSNREKQLQLRMKKQEGKRENRHGKDW